MTLYQELASWFAPKHSSTNLSQTTPSIGEPAPSTSKLPFSNSSSSSDKQNPIVLTFLRHCGCPFAEKNFLHLLSAASNPQNSHIDFIVISHSSQSHTQTWLDSILNNNNNNNGEQKKELPPNFRVVVDEDLEVYGAWGLGIASWSHVLGWSALGSVRRLATEDGIVNRPTESGSRWQLSGAFAVDGTGIVRWGHAAGRADEIFEFEEAVSALQEDGKDGGDGVHDGRRESDKL